MYDMRRKFRIVSGESVDYADKMEDAQLVAGEWQAERDRIVEIVRQQGRPKRWSATLEPSGHVRLDVLYSDGLPDTAKGFESLRAKSVAKLIDREDRRRARKRSSSEQAEIDAQHERSKKFGSGVKRAVVCLSTDPPRRFDQASDAARWLGVKHQSFFRSLKPRKNGQRRKCCGMFFIYEDQLPGGINGLLAKTIAQGSATANPATEQQPDAGENSALQQGAQPALPMREREEVEGVPRQGEKREIHHIED